MLVLHLVGETRIAFARAANEFQRQFGRCVVRYRNDWLGLAYAKLGVIKPRARDRASPSRRYANIPKALTDLDPSVNIQQADGNFGKFSESLLGHCP